MRLNRKPVPALLFLLTAIVVPSLHASDGSLTIAPAVMQLRGALGQTTTQTITITNGTSHPAEFDMVAYDVVAINGVRKLIPAGEISGSIAATAVFARKRVRVAPDASESVDVTITIPLTAKHRAVALIFQGTSATVQGSVHVIASLGSLATFNVTDETDVAAEPLKVIPQTSETNMRVAQWCTNQGSDPVVIRGVAAIVDQQGTIVRKLKIDGQRLLPGERLELNGELGGELPVGHYNIVVTYDLEGRKALTSSGEMDVR